MMRSLVLSVLLVTIFTRGLLFGQSTPQWLNFSYGENIYALAEEADYIWIGTVGGLVRMSKTDGSLQFFNRANSPLPSNAVHAIAIDSSGKKWLGTEGDGVLTYHNGGWETLSSDLYSGVEVYPNTIAVEENGTTWVGYQDAGLAVYDGNTWTGYRTWNSALPSEHVYDILLDANGTKWIGSGGGLVKIVGETWTIYDPTNSGIESYFIYSLARDADGNLWMATPDKGILIFSPGSGTWQSYNSTNSPLTTDKIYVVAIDHNNNKWFGTDQGVFYFDGQNWAHFNLDNAPLPNQYVYALLVDSQNHLWVGTLRGLVMFDGSEWSTYRTSNSPLPRFSISSLAMGRKINLWIGTAGGGLLRFDTANWQVYTSSNSALPGDNITALYMENGNRLWIGTQQNGIALLEGTDWSVFQNSAVTGYTVNCLVVDQNNNLWVGLANNGLVKYDGNSWVAYKAPDYPLPDNDILSLVVDSNNHLWIGTRKGVVRFDQGENWTVYDPTNASLPGWGILSLARDLSDAIWAAVPSYWNGTSWDKGGLAEFISGQWQTVSRNVCGLDGKSIHQLHIDANSNKWVATNQGLVKFISENNWEEITIENSRLPTNDITAVVTDSLGNIWIATTSLYEQQINLCAYNENGVVLGINRENQPSNRITGFQLHQNYPNPFNPSTTIEYDLPQSGNIRLTVYDVSGRKVSELVRGFQTAGKHKVTFHAQNRGSGVYLYQLEAPGVLETRKMLLIK